jgi:predicted CXXCH cytochrome family protein
MRRAAWVAGVLGLLFGATTAVGAPASSAELLARIGARASEGAAPGYLADASCGICHPDRHESFQHVGMARSLQRPRRESAIEDFANARFFHAASRQHFAMQWNEAGELRFRRWQSDPDGTEFNAIEQRVDWILGSGHRARVYLFRNPAGELHQLPIAWYSQARRWDMAPGYDRADHENLGRRIRRECLFCHNAFPEVAAGSDVQAEPAVFPEALPEGIGCQRCHGPGAAHAAAVLGGAPVDAIRAAIVNPRRLARARRDDVCFQCHLQPAVALMGLRRDGRSDYSFRPGEALSDYLLHVDIDEQGRARDERFEINHHGYRLSQSKCHREGGLGCIDCHDPHRGLKQDARLAQAADVCARCHQPHAVAADAGHPREACIACHMPRRRTQDVVHVVMTDHALARRSPTDALAPLRETTPSIVGLDLFDPTALAPGPARQALRARTVLQAVDSADALRALRDSVPTLDADTRAAWIDLVAAELKQGHFREALARTQALLAQGPEQAQFHAWLGVAQIALGQPTEAIASLRRALARAPAQAEFHLNLALALERAERFDEAANAAAQALQLRPNLVPAWLTRARLQERARDHAAARLSYEQALALEPRHARAWAGLLRTIDAGGDAALARTWRARFEALPAPTSVQ